MDAFEGMIRKITKLPEKEQRKILEKMRSLCICWSCPSYTGCAESAGETSFCTFGRSFFCISSATVCYCPKCPVFEDIGLNFAIYCIRGSEKAQRYDKHQV
jgi:hypothetical protein